MGRRREDWTGHESIEWQRGVRQLELWHEYCREKRVGIPETRIRMEEKTKRICGTYIHENPYSDLEKIVNRRKRGNKYYHKVRKFKMKGKKNGSN